MYVIRYKKKKEITLSEKSKIMLNNCHIYTQEGTNIRH